MPGFILVSYAKIWLSDDHYGYAESSGSDVPENVHEAAALFRFIGAARFWELKEPWKVTYE